MLIAECTIFLVFNPIRLFEFPPNKTSMPDARCDDFDASLTPAINESEADYVLRHSVKILKNVVNISVTKSNRTPR